MQPGIYSRQELSLEAYHSSPGLSNSGIKYLKKSPLHYWARYLATEEERTPNKDTPAKIVGRAFHCLLGEPELFESQFCKLPEREKIPLSFVPTTIEEITAYAAERGISLPKGKKEVLVAALKEKCPELQDWDAYAAEFIRGKTVLTPEQFDTVFRMTDSVLRHPAAKVLFRKGKTEQSIYWEHPTILGPDGKGVLLKTRPDFISDEGVIVDPKSAEDASQEKFQPDAWRYGYHVQAALAVDGYAAKLGQELPFVNLAIEKEYPYAVALYEQEAPELTTGRMEYHKYAETYAKCLIENSWPGYPPTIQGLGRPRWAAT